MPSKVGATISYLSVASSALSADANSTGVVWVCIPAIVFGVPALPNQNKTALLHHNTVYNFYIV